MTLEVDYAEPFDMLLDSKVFVLKGEFEKNIHKIPDGQFESTALSSLPGFLNTLKTQTRTKIIDFFSAGLSRAC